MTSEHWKQIEELYLAAVECDPEERAALFAASDPQLRATVEQMVAQGSAENFLDSPAWETDRKLSDSVSQRLADGTQLGPYRIEGIIGQGGMGAVHRAFDSRLNRDVAIKTVPVELAGDPDRLKRFQQEARAIGALNHPNILTVYDIGVHQGCPYLVSELLVGQTLRERLRGGKLTRRKALDYARMIAAGLIAAHERGITHRDLKPENLFLTKDGRIKILDFGLAKFTAKPHHFSQFAEEIGMEAQSAGSHPGLILGTVGYMSPEQIRAGTVDQRSDLFNFGLILYEMLTGKRAFEGATTIETLHAILKQEPQLSDDDREMGPETTRFLRHCLEKDPGNRFQSVKDLAFDLEGLPAPQPSVPSRRQRRVRTALLAAMSLLGLLLLLGGPELWRLRSQPAPSFRQITFRSGNLAGGRFSPDGQTVVYSAAWEGALIETFTTRLEGKESRQLDVPLSGVAAISRTGELALILGCELNWGECRGTLARMPLSGGAPREVIENVDYADWDDQGDLAIVRSSLGRSVLEYPLGQVLYESQTGWISHPRFSPHKDRIAFLNHPNLGNNDGSVEIVDLDGRRTTLVSERQGLKGLAWSPSGEEVWYSGGTAGNRSPSLRAVSLIGEERVVLQSPGWSEIVDIAPDGRVLLLRQNPRTNIVFSADDDQPRRDLSWFDWSTAADLSADARKLLFFDWGQAAGSEPVTYLRDTAGGEAIRLGEGRALALSPDNRWALTLKTGAPREMVLLPTGPGPLKRLPRSGIEIFYSGGWFPDGQRIFLTGERADLIPRSFIQQVDGGEAAEVGPEGIRVALVSPDGKLLAAYGPDGEHYLLPAGGGELRPIPGTEPGDEMLQWSADGRFLYLRALDDSRLDFVRLNLSNGRREAWKMLLPPDRVGFIGIENASGATRVTPDGKAAVYTYWQARGELYIAEGLR